MDRLIDFHNGRWLPLIRSRRMRFLRTFGDAHYRVGVNSENGKELKTVVKLSDYVINFVADLGVRHIFLLPGGGSMHLVDSVGRCKRLEYICNLHEQACAVAADAYGQYTNHLGVALVTTGPGGTNTITGVAGAWLDSTPCLFLSGQVKRADMTGDRGVRQTGFQEIDIKRLVGPITKYAVTVTDPGTIRYHLEKAVYTARNGRPGPVWVDIPLDVQALQINVDGLAKFDPQESPPTFSRKRVAEQAAEVIKLINAAERPVILVGNGVRLARTEDQCRELIELIGAPVLTTWKAIDFLPESHHLYAGRPGSVGQRGANFTQQNSDLLITLGARLDFGQTGYNHQNFARAAKKVIVDIDPAEIRKMDMDVAVPVAADVRIFIEEILKRRSEIARRERAPWLACSKAWQARYPVVLSEYWQDTQGVNNYVFVHALSQEMAADDLLIPGSSGACSEITMQAFAVKAGMRIFNTEGLGPMGFGIPAALGGCLAAGRRRTISIDGDGGFHMNNQELETVRRLNLPIKFFVLNNHGYASIRATQRGYFDGRFVASDPSSGLTLPDTRTIAAAYGIATAEIRDHEGLPQMIRGVLNHDGPIVCVVQMSPNQTTAPKLSSFQRPDGSFVSKPLEDLYPFLPREEFLANMIVPAIAE